MPPRLRTAATSPALSVRAGLGVCAAAALVAVPVGAWGLVALAAAALLTAAALLSPRPWAVLGGILTASAWGAVAGALVDDARSGRDGPLPELGADRGGVLAAVSAALTLLGVLLCLLAVRAPAGARAPAGRLRAHLLPGASLALGVLAVLLFGITGPVAVAAGRIALGRRDARGRQVGEVPALAGILTGAAATVFWIAQFVAA